MCVDSLVDYLNSVPYSWTMSSFFKGHNPIKGMAKSMNKVSEFVSTSLAPNPIKGTLPPYSSPFIVLVDNSSFSSSFNC